MKQLWILNISGQAINLQDFRIILRSGQKINLLHPRLGVSESEIAKSLQSGSLKNKSNQIMISRQEIKNLFPETAPEQSSRVFELPDRSIVTVEKSEHEDLFAEGFSELQINDQEPDGE